MMQLEEANYELTIVNQAKGIVVERLVELVPEMVSAIQSNNSGKQQPFRLEKCVLGIEDDVIRTKIQQVLKKYKLLA